MLERDNICGLGVPGLADLGIQPTPMEAHASAILGRYRRPGRDIAATA
jgi:NADH dehydrogenase